MIANNKMKLNDISLYVLVLMLNILALSSVYSQSIKLSSLDSSFVVSGLESSTLVVENLTPSIFPVKVMREVIDEVDGSSNYFCWVNCFLPTTNISPTTILFDPLELNDTDFIVYYNPGENCGATTVKYCAFLANNTSDSSCVTVRFDNTVALDTFITTCDSINWSDGSYYDSGVYSQSYVANNTCDSLVNLHLTVNTSSWIENDVFACDSVQIEGETIYNSGVHNYLFTNILGCDSVMSYDVNLSEEILYDVYEQTCDSLILDGEIYYESGEYTHVYASSNSCDSVVVMHLTVNSEELNIIQTGSLELTNENLTNIQWFLNEMPINNATAINYQPETAGYYYATAINDLGCSLISNIVNVSISGMQQYYENDKIIHIVDFQGSAVKKQTNIPQILIHNNGKITKQIIIDN
jgi:hypothetical protein